MRLIEQTPERMAKSLRRLVPQTIVPLNSRHMRQWSAMGNQALVSYARWKIASEGISGRKELERANNGLYNALLHRGLLGRVFRDMDSKNHQSAVYGVIDSLESFGDGG